jgi:signal transduction histidine kinase
VSTGRRWRSNIKSITAGINGPNKTIFLYALVLLVFPIALVQTYLAQQTAPMPGLQLLTRDPSVIYQVIPGSGAEEAGVRDGDLIRRMNGRPFNPEHLSRQIRGMQVGQLLPLELERGGQRFQVKVPLVPVYQITHRRFLLFVVIAFLFWLSSALFVWRRFQRIEMRLLFLLAQAISLGLLIPYVDIINWFSTSSWVVGMEVLGGVLSALLLFHFHITFPVVLGSPRQRKFMLGSLYGMGITLVAGWIIHNYTLYLPHVLGLVVAVYTALVMVAAITVQVYVYLRRATADGRRRLRVIMLGELIAGGPPALLYLGPSAVLGYPLIPEWLMAACLLVAPLAYLVATLRHNLFDIDRVLNRSIVYAILSLVIIVFFVAPISLIYWLIGDWPGHLVIVTILLLLAAAVFERTRTSVQHLVDRLFYGGWYDYPGVVEKISEALARSLEWQQLVDILTIQAPFLMHLRGASLKLGTLATPEIARDLQPQMDFPLVFEDTPPGQWIVGPRRDGEDFSSGDRRILRTLARQAAITASNVLLVRQIRIQMEEIRANREILSHMDHRLLSTREEERARLARDLHDGPVQALIGLNMHLGLALPVNTGQELREEIKNVIYDLRTTCAELRPPMLDTLGLGAALRALAADWSTQTGIPAKVDQPVEFDPACLPETVSVNLYRIAQEALSNIVRHAGASYVQLCLDWDPSTNQLCMTIHDDGQGFTFDPSHSLAIEGHLGLVNMQERAALIGGQWQIQSTPGQGTTVSVMWKAG